MKKKIAIVTATRAEYGILRPLITKINEEDSFELQLIVTGTHLKKEYGNTQEEIIKDGFQIYQRIPILVDGNTDYDISVTMANAISGFAKLFQEQKPDLLIVLGDRTEILGICCAAVNACIPIAHIHGGEITEGAVDDCIRHAVTKMSFLHFPANEEYRKRIIQLGEQPNRVYNVGALGVENILRVPLLGKEEICKQVGVPDNQKYVLVTFHPVTLENDNLKEQVEAFIGAIEMNPQYFYLITKSNADIGGIYINKRLEEVALERENVKLVASLGMLRYLSLMKYCDFVLGNSSSGIIEAPAFGVPTVNIGNRQAGRMMADTVVNCKTTTSDINVAMEIAHKMPHKKSFIYGDGGTSEKIVKVIKEYFEFSKFTTKKKFYDI